jgi:hypothetical protein
MKKNCFDHIIRTLINARINVTPTTKYIYFSDTQQKSFSQEYPDLVPPCTTTNFWLRPVEEELSIPACLEHSTSNLWPLGPGYRYSPHPPIWISVFLDFSFHWVWLWIGRSSGLLIICQRNAICLSSWHIRAFGLLNSLSSSWMYLLL